MTERAAVLDLWFRLWPVLWAILIPKHPEIVSKRLLKNYPLQSGPLNALKIDPGIPGAVLGLDSLWK